MNRLVAVLLLGGCSWAFMEPPPDKPDVRQEPLCTETKWFAAFDALFSAADIAALVAISDVKNPVNGDTQLTSIGGTIVAVGAIGGVLHAISMFSGLRNSDKCIESRAAHERYVSNMPYAASTRDAGIDVTLDAKPIDARSDAEISSAVPDSEQPTYR